jgi:23S rRNA pseudouridine1911/1915/1917 synthase
LGDTPFHIGTELNGQTLAAALRALVAGLSWSEARKHILARRAFVNDVVCVDEARRLKAGDVVELRSQSAKPLPSHQSVQVLHADEHLLVIAKPAGMECERRSEQRDWPAQKKLRQPTVVESLYRRGLDLFPVHRLDRDTSGLMVYATTPEAQASLIRTFAAHDIERRYLAVAVGTVHSQTIRNTLVRDRGDGLRGSATGPSDDAQEAITHITSLEAIAGGRYTLVECRLETGRTHQIRIHLAETGHPVCGEKLYLKPHAGAAPIVDDSKAPRQALHCHVLGFAHPKGGRQMHFELPWPEDLERWLTKLRTLKGMQAGG